MNDNRSFNPSYCGPPKKEWVVQKLPVKGLGVIRSAMQTEMFYQAVPWAVVEGKIES